MSACYADGRPYRRPWSHAHRGERPWGRAFESPGLLLTPCPADPAGSRGPSDWPQFWQQVQTELRNARFCTGSLRVYRQALRSFRAFAQARAAPADRRPSAASAELARAYVHELAGSGASASWLSVNISVLRTAFDKLGGLALTERMRGPKRARRLPETLPAAEVARLIEAGSSLRDRLLLGLLAHTGLKVGEACALRWGDVDLAAGTLAVRYACGTRTRTVAIPPSVRPLLEAGAPGRGGEDRVFAGRRAGTSLSSRMAERIVKQAARAAGLPTEVSAMRLRHSYAVARLREGMSIRELQERLGHLSMETTLEYQRLLAADGVRSPADALANAAASTETPATPAGSPPSEPAASPDRPPRPIWRRLVDSLGDLLSSATAPAGDRGRTISSA